jgi:hypothetical protein
MHRFGLNTFIPMTHLASLKNFIIKYLTKTCTNMSTDGGPPTVPINGFWMSTVL